MQDHYVLMSEKIKKNVRKVELQYLCFAWLSKWLEKFQLKFELKILEVEKICQVPYKKNVERNECED